MQPTRIGVGYDKLGAGGDGDVLITSGLTNCIAIAAYDKTTKNAIMAHLDTNRAWKAEGGFDVSMMAGLKKRMVQELEQRAAGEMDIEFSIALGFVWQPGHMVQQTEPLRLLSAELFGVQPMDGFYYSAEFDASTGTMTGIKIEGKPDLPKGWHNAGTDLDYDNLGKL